MKKSDVNQSPNYFDKYIGLVEDVELRLAFQQSIRELDSLDLAKLKSIGDSVYADGKWTIKEIFQHVIDTEHILSYRALRFARNDKTPLPGFDENLFAKSVDTRNRDLDSLIGELKQLRTTTVLLFQSFDDVALQRVGVASDNQMSVLALGFTIVGHQKHHWNTIAERYLPLASV